MKKPTYKTVISLLLCTGIIASVSCSGESNNAQTESQIENVDINQAQNAVVALNTEVASTDILAHGEEAHNNHCYKCHTDEVYTRDNRFVKSIDALSKQVVRCKDSTEAAWFDEDSEAVVQFLNQKYYKF